MRLLEIPWDNIGIFLDRPNRFLAIADIYCRGQVLKGEKIHVHDPGRLRELLYPGNRILVKQVIGVKKPRKTNWDLVAAYYDDYPVIVNSAYHRKISEVLLLKNIIFSDIMHLWAEVKLGAHRIDYLITNKYNTRWWVEIKGCTLAKEGVALFPDAPTTRGRKHLELLGEQKKKGDEAAVIFLVFRYDATSFSPNEETDPYFAEIFYEVLDLGVRIIPVRLRYDNKILYYSGILPVKE